MYVGGLAAGKKIYKAFNLIPIEWLVHNKKMLFLTISAFSADVKTSLIDLNPNVLSWYLLKLLDLINIGPLLHNFIIIVRILKVLSMLKMNRLRLLQKIIHLIKLFRHYINSFSVSMSKLINWKLIRNFFLIPTLSSSLFIEK